MTGRAAAERAGRRGGRRAACAEWLGAAIVCALGIAIFYRDPIFSGFREITGDRGDARYYTFILEHWYQVAAGRGSWASPPMFHPVTGVLGYSDAEFGQALPYAVLRRIGADPLLAFQLVKIGHNVLGFAGLFAFARYLVGAPGWLSAGAAFAFAFSNGLYLNLGHAQNLTIAYYPVVLILLAGAGRRLRHSLAQATGLAAAGGLALALLFFTGYYMGFYFVLLGGFVLVLYGLFDFRAVRGYVTANARRLALTAGAAVGALLVGLIPFFTLYLPVVRAGGGRRFAEVMYYSPGWHDLLNYGGANLLWGWISRHLTDLPPARLIDGGKALAPTPLLILGAVGLWFWLLSRHRPVAKRTLRMSAALFLAGGLLVLSTVAVDGISGWWLIWKLVPGADGIRATYRIALPVQGALVLVILLCGTALLKHATPASLTWRHSLVFTLVLLVAIGQVNLQSRAHIDRRAERAWLAAMPPPPPSCRRFVAIDSRMQTQPSLIPALLLEIDALQIAHQTGLPTINGYSGLLPPGWGLLDANRANAHRAALAWIASHGLQDGFCVFDRGTNAWSVGTDELRR